MYTTRSRSAEIFAHNRHFIAGGVVSLNRATDPEIVFVKGRGAYMWDADGHRYIDYHAAFAPHLLGHNDSYVNEAAARALAEGASLFGTGTTVLEGKLAELICRYVPSVESVQLLNSGSEATYQAIRLARAVTGRDHVIVMQGGYNGWHNDVSCNLMTPLDQVGPRVSPGEYPYLPLSSGIPRDHQRLVHVVNFNDLESVEYVASRNPIACLITEPVLQNIGVVKPLPDYLEGLRTTADRHGFVLIFDEVKTGFRHALGGFGSIAGVKSDLVVLGKALANGYPMAVLGGKKELMNWFVHPDPAKRVMLGGTYNAHPVPTAAAIATIERLAMNDGEVYTYLESLGAQMEAGLNEITEQLSVQACVARQGSAFCIYFMDHCPRDWHDLAAHHDFDLDQRLRKALIDRGIYVFPVSAKQWSISSSHQTADIDETLTAVRESLTSILAAESARLKNKVGASQKG